MVGTADPRRVGTAHLSRDPLGTAPQFHGIPARRVGIAHQFNRLIREISQQRPQGA
jgi:hypothetical protein